MRLWYSLKSTQQQEMISNEESTVYSQAIHYANRMVYMRVPLDIAKRLKEPYGLERESSSSNITNRYKLIIDCSIAAFPCTTT